MSAKLLLRFCVSAFFLPSSEHLLFVRTSVSNHHLVIIHISLGFVFFSPSLAWILSSSWSLIRTSLQCSITFTCQITLNITVKNPKKPLASKKPKANAPSSNAATAETSTAGRKRKVVEVEMGNEDDVDGDEQEGNEGSEESGAVSDDEEY